MTTPQKGVLDALDELTVAQRHIELIEMATRQGDGDGVAAINATCWTALGKISAAQELLQAAQWEIFDPKTGKMA